MSAQDTPARRIGLVIYPGFKTLEATGPLSVLHYANEHLRVAGRPTGYDVTVMAPRPGHVPSDTLVSLEATEALPQGDLPNTVFIAGAAAIEDALEREADLVRWCRRHWREADRFAALCTGSFFLAAAGLLDGKPAATHWNYAERLAQLFPEVQVDADAIFVQSGSLWTSAGVTAAIDLSLAFVEQDHGRDIALRVARDMVMYLKRPGGQSQFSTVLTGQMSGASGVADVRSWASLNLEQPMTLDDLATRAGMSVRSFTRAFTAEVGLSPMAWLEQVRSDRARTLLLDGDLPLKAIAQRAGFRSDEQMRKVFRRRFSLSPRDYRARFTTSRSA
ncbi:AraC family transcriptional regulator [Salipiger pallidus]|uniref:AraC family transcriptional regulator n=1 Tax=Salipiger pallidus TaxID=1775170 RepID=A0A8J2ZGR5_9RHOB|nr:helix-turn-helix domain-containing protein [Salipiger pallidus]GGG61218.1 AraC family transcriptional regulator [Salipiger pallidus]